jgi:type I restriction enzyme S subunit
LEHIESETGRRLGAAEVSLSSLQGRKPCFYRNDIVYGYLRPYLNKVWVAEFDGLCSVDQYVYAVDRRLALPEYLAAFMRSRAYLQRAPVDSGPGQLPRIRTEEVAAVPLALPPLAEQPELTSAINAQLSIVTTASTRASEQSDAARALGWSYLREAFRGITPLTAVKQRDAAPSGWRWAKLSALANLESGHTPSRYHPEYWGGSIPWIALPDIRGLDGREALETTEYTNELGIANSSARVLPAGTVVLSRTASVGFVTIMGQPMATSQDFVNWVCGPQLDPRFLMHLLRTARPYIRSLSSGAVHQTVYVPTVEAFEVCAPEVEEQRRIARTLDARLEHARDLVRILELQREALGALPPAILDRAFSWEV